MKPLVLAFALFAQDGLPGAKQLLDEAAARLKDAPALAYQFTVTRTSDPPPPVPEEVVKGSTSYTARRPNLMRVESSSAHGENLAVFDGKHMWNLSRHGDAQAEFMRYRLKSSAGRKYSSDPLVALYLGREFHERVERARDVRMRQETLDGVKFQVITGRTDDPDRDGPSDLVERFELWLGPDWMPRKYVLHSEGSRRLDTEIRVYEKIDLAPKLAAETFVFAPPADARELRLLKDRKEDIPKTPAADQAQKVLVQVREAFQRADAIRYEYDETTTHKKGPSHSQPRATTTLKRLDLLRREVGPEGSKSLQVCDGATVWHAYGDQKSFMKVPQEGAPNLHDDPVLDLFFAEGTPLLLAGATDVSSVKEELEGFSCDLVGWTDPVGKRRRLWIDPDRRPRQFIRDEGIVQMGYNPESGKATTRLRVLGETTIKYRSFDLSPALPEGHFAFKPPADWRDMAAKYHPAVGSVAPDFEAKDRDGTVVRLSQFHGQPVMLLVSRNTIDPATVDRFQDLHEDFGARGVTVLVLAIGDDPRPPAIEAGRHTLRLVRTKDDSVMRAYGVDREDADFLIDSGGKVAFVGHDSGIGAANLRAAAARLIPPTAANAATALGTLKKAAAALRPRERVGYSATWRLDRETGLEIRAKCLLARVGQRRIDGSFIFHGGAAVLPFISVLDGKTSWSFYSEAGKCYLSPQTPDGLSGLRLSPAETTVGRELDQWRKSLRDRVTVHEDPLALLFFGDPPTLWMNPATDWVQARKRLQNRACAVIEWRVPYSFESSYRLWIDEETLNVRRLEKRIGNAVVLTVEYDDIDLAPKVGDRDFTFTPAEETNVLKWHEAMQSKLSPSGAQAPAFEASGLDDKRVELSNFRGRTVLVHFWGIASLDRNDVAELPQLEQLRRDFEESGLSVVALNRSDRPWRIRRFLEKHDFGFKILVDEESLIARKFGADFPGISFLVGPEGSVLWAGLFDSDTIRGKLKSLEKMKR